MPETRLAPCPETPNCVSSLADSEDRVHHTRPLEVAGERDEAMAKVKAAAASLPRTTLQAEEPGYLHFVSRTRLFRFRDDLEMEWAEPGVVHVRSASRLGGGDLGVNRKRVRALREALAGS